MRKHPCQSLLLCGIALASLLGVGGAGSAAQPLPPAALAAAGAADRGDWVSEQVPLYYFDSVDRLIRMLVPGVTKVGDDSLRNAADASAEALELATQDLLKARQEVSDARREIALRQEEVRQVRIELQDRLRDAARERDAAERGASAEERKTERLRAQFLEAQRHEAVALAGYNRKKADFDALPAGDSGKEAARQRMEDAKQAHAAAQADKTRLEAEYNDQKTRETAAEGKVTTAQGKVNTLEGQLDGAEGPLKAAEDRLKAALTAEQTAAGAVRTQMSAAYIAALKDVRDFARARDSAPFLRTEPLPSDPDPVKRVMLAGFPDSRVLFIRGPKQDVERVKLIVAQLDRPQPQALLTLYTLEINSDGTTKGATRAAEALGIIDEELRAARDQVQDTLDALRDSIRVEVDLAVAELRKQYENNPDLDPDVVGRTSADVLGARAFFHPEFTRRLGWEDLTFFGRRAEGEEPAPGVPIAMRAVIPQPGRTTSLAEALVAASLADSRRRRLLLDRFEKRLRETCPEVRMPNLTRFLKPDGEGDTRLGRGMLSNFQQEMLWALRRNPPPSLERYVEYLSGRLKALRSEETRLERQLGEAAAPDRRKIEAELLRAQAGVQNVRRQFRPLRDALYGIHGLPAAPGLAPEDGVPQLLPRTPQDNAREAVVNEQLKALIQGVDDDLRRSLIDPMLVRLRQRLLKTGVGVGIINRTSVLGSNRLVARVDPRASANLAMGEDTNVLEGALQLAQLAMGTQAGGPLGFLDGLRQIDKQKREPPPAIYGLGTGSVFQVTPIGDPSGQAVRFRFDFVSATQVREPTGVTDPQLSRIERHSVNTEVQVSNLEIREFSRFQTNARLGLPTRTSGGIPIVKDLPLIREIPLLGWFSKRKGSAASVQQNLILGQTTLLPTVAEVMQVLGDPSAVPAAVPESSL